MDNYKSSMIKQNFTVTAYGVENLCTSSLLLPGSIPDKPGAKFGLKAAENQLPYVTQ